MTYSSWTVLNKQNQKIGPVAETSWCQVFPMQLLCSSSQCDVAGVGCSGLDPEWLLTLRGYLKHWVWPTFSALVFPQSRNQRNTCCLHEPVGPLSCTQATQACYQIWQNWEVWQYVLAWFMQNSIIVLLKFFAFILHYSLLQSFGGRPQWAIRIICGLH